MAGLTTWSVALMKYITDELFMLSDALQGYGSFDWEFLSQKSIHASRTYS